MLISNKTQSKSIKTQKTGGLGFNKKKKNRVFCSPVGEGARRGICADQKAFKFLQQKENKNETWYRVFNYQMYTEPTALVEEGSIS